MRETALVATLGTAPQVVTLALDALLSRGHDIHRVVVIHTLADEGPVRDALRILHDEFVSQRRYGDDVLFIPHILAGTRGPLQDVLGPDDADDAFQSVYSLLRQYKHAGYRVHLSIAGGRKTMAVTAMAAAQILFEPGDAVWHLISTPHLVHSQRLHTGNEQDVTLVSVPIVAWGRMQTNGDTRTRDFLANVLTPAEREVTQLLLQEGLSNTALAERLSKSPKTVANQLSSVYGKLGDSFGLEQAVDRTMLLLLLGKAT